MHHRIFAWLLVGLFAAALTMRAQTAGVPEVKGGAEEILVARVTGTAQMTVNGVTTALQQNQKVPPQAKIVTLNNSRVVLVFNNGATIAIEGDSEFILEEYLQDPFNTELKIAEATAEPSASRTKVMLNRGEIVGDVKKLNYAKGSSFTVKTPVGAAGIRGTKFRIVFRPTGNGQAFNFQLNTTEGNVAFAQGVADVPPPPPPTDAANNPGGGNNQPGTNPNPDNNQPGNNQGGNNQSGVTSVPQGQQIIIVDVEVTFNAQGQAVITAPPQVAATTPLPPTTAALIAQVSTDIAIATQNTVFTPPPPTSTSSGNTNTGGANTNTNDTGSGGNPQTNATPANDNSGQGTGNQSGGQGSGNQGSGSQGSGNQGSGNQGGGNQGSGNQGSGNQGSGNQGSGNQGSGNQGSGNQGSGNQGSGNQGSGSQGSGGTTQIQGPNFQGTVTTSPPPQQPVQRVTTGDGRPGT